MRPDLLRGGGSSGRAGREETAGDDAAGPGASGRGPGDETNETQQAPRHNKNAFFFCFCFLVFGSLFSLSLVCSSLPKDGKKRTATTQLQRAPSEKCKITFFFVGLFLIFLAQRLYIMHRRYVPVCQLRRCVRIAAHGHLFRE